MKGIIALDIDGTITQDIHSVPSEVVTFLEELTKQGWVLYFLTGRSFQFASQAIGDFKFPYYLAVINGALILKMPSIEKISSKYLNTSILAPMDLISNFVIYSGYENRDLCYYRPRKFSPEMLDYVLKRAEYFREKWVAVNDFNHLGFEEFPSIKCIDTKKNALRIAERAFLELGLSMPVINDPFREGYFVAQGTHHEVNKGWAVRELKKVLHFEGLTIAAGDDYNDLPMLLEADIRIVMESAPEPLQAHAHKIAKNGIIEALRSAI